MLNSQDGGEVLLFHFSAADNASNQAEGSQNVLLDLSGPKIRWPRLATRKPSLGSAAWWAGRT